MPEKLESDHLPATEKISQEEETREALFARISKGINQWIENCFLPKIKQPETKIILDAKYDPNEKLNKTLEEIETEKSH